MAARRFRLPGYRDVRRLALTISATGGLATLARYVVVDRLGRRFLPCWPELRECWRGGRGLEVGGPSPVFQSGGALPIYSVVSEVDFVDYAPATVWTQPGQWGRELRTLEHIGRHRFTLEATDLRGLPSESYDFLLASHVLEHLANPLRALREWGRVVRPGGGLVVVVPPGGWTFDRRRPVTPLSHLQDDERVGRGEDDTSHFAEILALHDLALDELPETRTQFERRLADNLRLRSAHHHVFDSASLAAALAATGWRVRHVTLRYPIDRVAVADRPAGTEALGAEASTAA